MTNYWHMQIHPDDVSFSDEHLHAILEQRSIIGVGEWEKGQPTIYKFNNIMKVNDIVAIKKGAKLIALVQIIGGAYQVTDDDSPITGWIEHRRPIRVLDWELWGRELPQPRGTLERCASDVETTSIIKDWHSRVNTSFRKRGIPTSV